MDNEAAAQAHINSLAGACLALSIKYAGTANAAARDLLHNYVLYFLSAKQAAPDPVSGAGTVPPPACLPPGMMIDRGTVSCDGAVLYRFCHAIEIMTPEINDNGR